MTQKELLYLEDAIGHETNIIKILEETITFLEDKELVSFMKQETKKHNSMKEKLLKVLEGQANE